MRYLFALLALANVAAFVWLQWWAKPVVPPPRPRAGGDLVLLADSPLPDRVRCFTLTPPLAAEPAQRLQERLTAAGYEVDRSRDGEATVYWVHLPRLPDLDAARARVDALRATGVTGATLATGRGWTNAVSLGVYDREGPARERLRAVRAQGFDAKLARRTMPRSAPGRLEARGTRTPPDVPGHRWRSGVCEP